MNDPLPAPTGTAGRSGSSGGPAQTGTASFDAGTEAAAGQPPSGLVVALGIEDEAWEAQGLGDLAVLVETCAAAVFRRLDFPQDLKTEIGATFTSDAEIRGLNAEWRGKDAATNVLSFPLEPLEPGDVPGAMLGDLVFARETLLREAAAEEKSLHDHLCHLAVHGVLHCLGFDHVEPEDGDEMEELEILILGDLGIGNPYAAGEPAGGLGTADGRAS